MSREEDRWVRGVRGGERERGRGVRWVRGVSGVRGAKNEVAYLQEPDLIVLLCLLCYYQVSYTPK